MFEYNGIAENIVYVFSNFYETEDLGRVLHDGTLQTATFSIPARTSLDDSMFALLLSKDDFE